MVTTQDTTLTHYKIQGYLSVATGNPKLKLDSFVDRLHSEQKPNPYTITAFPATGQNSLKIKLANDLENNLCVFDLLLQSNETGIYSQKA